MFWGAINRFDMECVISCLALILGLALLASWSPCLISDVRFLSELQLVWTEGGSIHTLLTVRLQWMVLFILLSLGVMGEVSCDSRELQMIDFILSVPNPHQLILVSIVITKERRRRERV